MNAEADDDFYDDKGEVQHDADHKGPVDAGDVDGMVVVTEAAMVVIMAVAVAAMIMVVVVVVVVVVTVTGVAVFVVVIDVVGVIVVAMIVCLFHKYVFTCNHLWPEQSCR